MKEVREAVKNFLEKNENPDYKEIIVNMITNFGLMGCSMTYKLHFNLNLHIDYFSEYLGAVSEE